MVKAADVVIVSHPFVTYQRGNRGRSVLRCGRMHARRYLSPHAQARMVKVDLAQARLARGSSVTDARVAGVVAGAYLKIETGNYVGA